MAAAEPRWSGFCGNLGAVEDYRPGPEHYGDDKGLPGLPWGRFLRQGKTGKSLTMPFALFARKSYGLALSEAAARRWGWSFN